jgi:hypothetical protein
MMRNPFGIVLRAPFWRVFETSIISEPLIPVTSYVPAACGTLSAFVVFPVCPHPGFSKPRAMMRNPFGIVLRAPFWRVFETSIISEPLIPVTSYVPAACGTLSAFVVFPLRPHPGFSKPRAVMRNPFGIVLRAPFWRVFET